MFQFILFVVSAELDFSNCLGKIKFLIVLHIKYIQHGFMENVVTLSFTLECGHECIWNIPYTTIKISHSETNALSPQTFL